jgi:GXWXG protein/Domain of unknown function (DUF4334)
VSRLTTTESTEAVAEGWLAAHAGGATPEEALAFFDGLPPVAPQEMTGRWRGSGLPTGSPLDGLLEGFDWYGKEFLDDETVHPLLFRDGADRIRPLDPRLLPMGVLRDYAGFATGWPLRAAFRWIRPLLYTDMPKARLREVSHRGVVTAAMVYDALPIIDVFRRVGDDVRIGAMDMRGLPSPYLFVLRRD